MIYEDLATNFTIRTYNKFLNREPVGEEVEHRNRWRDIALEKGSFAVLEGF